MRAKSWYDSSLNALLTDPSLKQVVHLLSSDIIEQHYGQKEKADEKKKSS